MLSELKRGVSTMDFDNYDFTFKDEEKTQQEYSFNSADEIVENERKKGDVQANVFVKRVHEHQITSNNFVLMFVENIEILLDEYELTNMELKVLMYILDKMKHGNMFSINQKKLAEKYNTSQSAISRYIKNLIKKNLIIEDEDKNRFINSTLFLKGNISSMKQELRDNVYKSQKTFNKYNETVKNKTKQG